MDAHHTSGCKSIYHTQITLARKQAHTSLTVCCCLAVKCDTVRGYSHDRHGLETEDIIVCSAHLRVMLQGSIRTE